MKCPNKKHRKPVDLKVKRTYLEGRTVRRECWCPKCKETVWTVAQFEEDIKDQKEAHRVEVSDLEEKISDLECKLDDREEVLKGLARVIKEVGE